MLTASIHVFDAFRAMTLIIKISVGFFLHDRQCGQCWRPYEEQEGPIVWSDLEEGVANLEQK